MRKTALVFLLIAGFMISGCNLFNQKKQDTVSQARIGQRETQLMKRLEWNYSDSSAHYQLGKYYMANGQLEKAEYEFHLALGFDPVNRDAQAAMVKTMVLAGREPRAKQLADIYIGQVCVLAEDSLVLGRAFQAEGLEEYALACYQQAIALAPGSASLQKQVGYLYMARGEKVRAEEYFRRSFQLDPYQADVAGELGKMGVVVSIPPKKPVDPIGDMWDGLTGMFKSDKKKAQTQQSVE